LTGNTLSSSSPRTKQLSRRSVAIMSSDKCVVDICLCKYKHIYCGGVHLNNV
jgi:hypothetical protein